jgi:ketosteroid isomerase-like protein
VKLSETCFSRSALSNRRAQSPKPRISIATVETERRSDSVSRQPANRPRSRAQHCALERQPRFEGARMRQRSGMSHEGCSRPHGVTVNGVSTSEIFVAHSRKGVPVSAEENTRLVQGAYEAFGRGDMAAFAEVMADDIEWVDPGDPDDDPNAGTFKGKEAVLGWFGGLASTLDYTTFEPREFIAQNDKVVSLVYSEATVRDTGRAFVNPEAHVWTIRDGKLARFQSYHDTAAAAAAHRVE